MLKSLEGLLEETAWSETRMAARAQTDAAGGAGALPTRRKYTRTQQPHQHTTVRKATLIFAVIYYSMLVRQGVMQRGLLYPKMAPPSGYQGHHFNQILLYKSGKTTLLREICIVLDKTWVAYRELPLLYPECVKCYAKRVPPAFMYTYIRRMGHIQTSENNGYSLGYQVK